MFGAFAQIKAAVKEDSILVNVSSGDNVDNCAALAAAYVNGLKAFNVMEDRVMMLPVLKFSYYRLIQERKLKILKFLKEQPDCCSSLEDLSERLKVSLPLISYHINGSAKAEGLISLGLVEVHIRPHGRTQVILTELGKLITEGLIETPQTKDVAQVERG
jgi:DNA-binding transcriptional ArsR family regulator